LIRGPYVGWAATVVATASVFLSTILFFVGSKKYATLFPRGRQFAISLETNHSIRLRERIVENFEEQLLGNN
jgi:hypothetical protein